MTDQLSTFRLPRAANAAHGSWKWGIPAVREPDAEAKFYCLLWPVVDGVSVRGGTVTAGGAVFGAMPVVAGGLPSLLAVLVPSLLVNTSARITMMNTAPAIHPHGVGDPIL